MKALKGNPVESLYFSFHICTVVRSINTVGSSKFSDSVSQNLDSIVS